MRKVFISVLSLAIMLSMTLVSTTFAQTSQVSYHNGDSVPLFQGTLAYEDNYSYDSLVNYIISSDEAFYSAQYYGDRTDSPVAIKLAVLDGYVVWQFDFVDQIICIDAQNATNAYALPIDGIAYTYIIDDFSYNNAVYSNTAEAASYVDSGNASTVVYETPVYDTTVQENYNISSGGYSDLYAGFATYEEYLAAYMASTSQMMSEQIVEVAPTTPAVSSYSEVVYLGSSASSSPTISIQPVATSPAVVGPVENLGIIPVNTVGSSYTHDGYDAEGYDGEGYDREGYSRPGYDREGYDREGYSEVGYDREGYNREGYNVSGYDREGYNAQGYNSAGYNRIGEMKSN